MVCAFEKLPAELRIRIYEEVLPSGKHLVPCIPKMRFGAYPSSDISEILATNRNIHMEAGMYLYGNNFVDLNSTFAGHVGDPTSIWRRFGPNIQHVEMRVTDEVINAFHALFYGDPLEIETLEHLWQWEKDVMDGIASTGLKSLILDMRACIAPLPWEGERMMRTVALMTMLKWLMENVRVERSTLRWFQWDDEVREWKVETTESQHESRPDGTKSLVKHLTVRGLLDIGEARAAVAVVGHRQRSE